MKKSEVNHAYEVDANGQSYWLEPPPGLPMAQAMAHLLVSPEEYALC